MNKFFVLFFVYFVCLAAHAEERPAVFSRKEPKSSPAKVRVVTAQGEEIKDATPARVKMLPPDEDEELVKSLLDAIASSMKDKNLRKYSSCFTKEFMSKNKSKTALMFLEDNLNINVEKFQIVESDDSQVEFVIKYTTSFGKNEFTNVSNIFAKKENDGLVVNKENVISSVSKTDSEVPANFGMQKNPAFFDDDGNPINNPELFDGNGEAVQNCPDGKCKFAPKNPKAERKPKKPFSLFNDANGNPDPNGPMWLPIETLMEAYPEDYKNCECMKNRK
jgi:hypothetical protein